MSVGTPGSDQHRTRLGLPFLVLGTILMLWAWGSWIYRASNPLETAGATSEHLPAPSTKTVRAVRISPLILVVGLVLVLLFFFGSYAIVRAARRYRDLVGRKRPPPTPSDDVWTMHKLQDRPDDEEL